MKIMMLINILSIAKDGLLRNMLTGTMYMLEENLVFSRSWNLANLMKCSHKKANIVILLQYQIPKAFKNIICGCLKNGGSSACAIFTPNGQLQHDVFLKGKPWFLALNCAFCLEYLSLIPLRSRWLRPRAMLPELCQCKTLVLTDLAGAMPLKHDCEVDICVSVHCASRLRIAVICAEHIVKHWLVYVGWAV